MHTLQALINADWTPRNLGGVQRALTMAYAATADLCDPNRTPFLGTPNRPFGIGYNRWLAVDFYLAEACRAGWITGITARWISLGGNSGTPLSALEVQGAHTSVLAVHLRDQDAPPRDSGYRYDKRVSNERYPLLTGFVDPHGSAPSRLLNLLLVHGDKNAEFAELRAYDDADNRASFTAFTGNIMAGTLLPVATDAETIPEPSVTLIPAAKQKASGGA